MKKIIIATCLALCAAPLMAQDSLAANTLNSESGWFDFGHCEYCKAIGDQPGLLDQTTWENHAISNGMMNIVTVSPTSSPAMAAAQRKIANLSSRVDKGELDPLDLKMCQRCRTMGELIRQDVRTEEVQGELAVVTLVTSDDPRVVAKLHEIARRDTEEMDQLKRARHNNY